VIPDGDDLPSRKSLARPKQVIDLTLDDDDDSKGDDDVFTEVSWLRNTRMARYRGRLNPTPLTGRFQVADQLPFPSPPTVLPAKAIRKPRRRLHNVVYSGHTRQEGIPLDQSPFVVPIIPQASTTFR
jgi:hypothetical protein